MKKTFRIGIIGHFGKGRELLNGQTIKTKTITAELINKYSDGEVITLDTAGGPLTLLRSFFQCCFLLIKCENVIMLPAHNGVRYYTPVLLFWNKFFKKKLHYAVVGGWLPEFLEKRRRLARKLAKFDGIYVEAKSMKRRLDGMGFDNTYMLPNFKSIRILDKDELVYSTEEPYRLCTFSRVMKEKGIEDAVNAVAAVNAGCGRRAFTLDIYGQTEPAQIEWFDRLQGAFPDGVSYGGEVPYDRSTEVLKNYFALLFPTYYSGEGFAGTLIDAMAAGVPVIASNWRYNGEIIKSGINGRVYELNDKDGLKKELEYALKNVDILNAMKPDCLHECRRYTADEALRQLTDRL